MKPLTPTLLMPFSLLAALCVLAALLSKHPAQPPSPLADEPPTIATAPRGSEVAVSVQLAQPVVESGGEVFAQVEVTGVGSEDAPSSSANLVLVLDRSGSMRGQKLEDAKSAAARLVEALGSADRVALVDYGSEVAVVESARCDETHKARVLRTIYALNDNGGTNISAALEAAAQALAATETLGRVILMTDGNPTEGDVSDGGLRGRVTTLRERGHAVSAIGVGVDYNEVLLQSLAEAGGGIYGFIENSDALEEVLGRELHQASRPVARNVELLLDLREAQAAEVLGRSSRIEGGHRVIALPNLAAGQTERVMLKLRAPEGGIATLRNVLTASARYLRPEGDGAPHATAPQTGRVRFARTVGEVVEHRNEEVFANALRALGARELTRAREELQRGRPEAARSIFHDVRKLFSASADLLAGDINLLGASAEALAGDPNAQVIASEQKKAHSRALSNFGQTTY